MVPEEQLFKGVYQLLGGQHDLPSFRFSRTHTDSWSTRSAQLAPFLMPGSSTLNRPTYRQPNLRSVATCHRDTCCRLPLRKCSLTITTSKPPVFSTPMHSLH